MTSRLYAFMNTPRLIKRFVNVYRLLRSGVPHEEFENFIRRNRLAEHRVVQVLLAINVGFPRLGSELLRCVTWPEDLPQDVRFERWSDLVAALDPTAEKKSALVAHLETSVSRPEDLAELQRLLDGIKEHVPDLIEPFKKWAPRVGRYSMYWQGR